MLGIQAFTSCAYVQTHKNVEEFFTTYEGAQIGQEVSLYQSGSSWYLAADSCVLSKRYPAVFDSILLDEHNEPTFHVEQKTGSRLYYPISAGTATVLQRNDGYASLSILRDEMLRHAEGVKTTLPKGARAYPVLARLAEGEEPNAGIAAGKKVPEELSPGVRLLSKAEEVLVDWPATVGYNCLIPVMAPIVFFKRFMNEE